MGASPIILLVRCLGHPVFRREDKRSNRLHATKKQGELHNLIIMVTDVLIMIEVVQEVQVLYSPLSFENKDLVD